MAKNVLFMMADDLYDWDRYRTRWGITVETPNFDRLIAKGTKFANAFAPITVCHPSRTATMSGYTPWQTGIFNNYTPMLQVLDADQLWPMEFRKAGHYLGTAGKIYHSEDNSAAGVMPIPELNERLYDSPAPDLTPLYPDENTYEYVDFTEGYTSAGVGSGNGRGGYGFIDADEQFFDYKVAQTFIDFITSYDGARPFYWECGFSHPHVPRHIPIRFIEDIPLEELFPPPDWEGGWEIAEFAADAFVTSTLDPPSLWPDNLLKNWRVTVRIYIAALRHLDYQIGRVLDALEASPFADNTVVSFFSDHGYELWSHGHYQKFTLWEQSAAVPFVVCDPDSPGGKIETQPVSLLDMGPTVMDLADVPVPSHHMGRSLRAAVEGTGPPPQDRMILSAWYSGVSGRTPTHRITLYSDGSSEYYNVEADPWTQDNLVEDTPESYAADRTALLELAQEWGVLIVEEGVDIARPTPFAIYAGKSAEKVTLAGRVYVSYGDLMPENYPRGAKKAWVQPGRQGQTLRVPIGFEKIGVPHNLVTSDNVFTIRANAQNNTLDVAALNAGFELTLDLGEGADVATGLLFTANIDAGPGNDEIRAPQATEQVMYGGAGGDTLQGGQRADFLSGGSGRDELRGSGGDDTLVAGAGDDSLYGWSGDDVLRLDQGANVASGEAGADTFVVSRTGRTQTIVDFEAADTLDLADWSGIAPVTVTQVGSDVEITAALERIVCLNATAATVASRISGAAVAA